jgi:hypothetical protein
LDHHTTHPHKLKGISGQHRKLIFGMQTYFDPTRKMTEKKKKMEDDLNEKKINWKMTSIKKIKMEDDLKKMKI